MRSALATGGVWSPEIRVSDVTSNQHSYTGEALYDWHAAQWNMPTSSDESRLSGGTLTVLGKPYDAVPPQVSELRIDHPTVDTLPAAADGWWRVDLHFAQGTPPGWYRISHIYVRDGHTTSPYAGPGDPDATNWPTLPDGSYRTVAGAAWDGAIAVVDNPAAG